MIQPLIQYPGFASGDPVQVKYPGFASTADKLRVAYPGVGIEELESRVLMFFPLYVADEVD